MKRLMYISPLPQDSQTGGANAVNFHTYKALQKYFDCSYAQINPEETLLGKRWSQFQRKVLKRPARFNYFSKTRLQKIAQQFESLTGHYDVIFFRGFTPWIYCQPKVPYVAYNDVHFLQFFRNTFPPQEFHQKDILRIGRHEQQWLRQAKALAFESAWGLERCAEDYNLEDTPLRAVGRGGHIPLPETDAYKGDLILVVIANHFYQKGGDLVFQAFEQLKPLYPQLELHIVGGAPESVVLQTTGVVYHGYLYKERPHDLEKLTQLLAKAFLLMHVTREDVNPLVTTEAGYFGCPCISVEHFAIPELVQHEKTGFLLPYLPDPKEIASAVEQLIKNPQYYRQMRQATWDFNRKNYSWDTIGYQLKALIATE